MAGKKLDAVLSSDRMDWATPVALYNQLDELYHFTLDAAADASNAKCERYFTEKDSGLLQPWTGERVFLNPPYGDALPAWVEKAARSVILHGCDLAVCLVTAKPDTQWWRNWVMLADAIDFVVGRIQFEGADSAAPFPSALVIYGQPAPLLDGMLRWRPQQDNGALREKLMRRMTAQEQGRLV